MGDKGKKDKKKHRKRTFTLEIDPLRMRVFLHEVSGVKGAQGRSPCVGYVLLILRCFLLFLPLGTLITHVLPHRSPGVELPFLRLP